MAASVRSTGESIPLFPLASVVLFPKLQIPLYIFEPRYREMTRSALTGDRRIGMVTVRPEHVAEMVGDPPLFSIGCAGSLESCRERSDGSFDIVLRGTSRFRVLREIERGDARLYRRAEIELLPDATDESSLANVERLRADVSGLCRELLELGERLQQPVLRGLERIEAQLLERLDHESLVNVLSVLVDFATLEKQSLLEAANIGLRYEMLISLMKFRLASSDACGPSDPNLMQ